MNKIKFLLTIIMFGVLTLQGNAIGQNEVKNMNQLINQDRLADSFIRYVKFDTGSDAELAETQIPSTEKQTKFAKELAVELRNLGLQDITIDKHSIVTATLPSNCSEDMPIIALFAHMDTSSDVPTGPVNPQIHNYQGGDIVLQDGIIISAEDLKPEKGNRIITSDGTTLLGSDDKSGVAEIMEALNVLVENPSIKRPEIKVVFTPDEETGLGVSVFDAENFKADAAYTVDGGAPHELDTETFNAFNPEIIIKGKVVHCGYAYKKMINSLELANEFLSKLPKNQTPSTTKDKEGYYYIDEIKGTAEQTTIKMLVRDFDLKKANKKIKFIEKNLKKIEEKYPGCEITFDPKQRYLNMKENLQKFPEVILFAEEGIRRSGLEPVQNSVRGGTDGSALTYRGLLTPNLGAGGINFHSKTEFVSVETMSKCCENVLNILVVWAEKAPEVMPKIQKRRN
ncbi:MAG: peptidase T [Candidatus Gastranaerophilaceae bacterium]